MMKLILGLLALTLAACSTTQSFTAPSQNYRLQGQESPIAITGFATNKATMRAFDTISDTNVTISFDGMPMIQGKLDQQLTGQLTGLDYKGKPTSADCTSKLVGQNRYDVSCTVFIGNEKTVTLTF